MSVDKPSSRGVALLSATAVTKIYPNPAHRLRLLWHALIKPNKPYLSGHKVLDNISLEIYRGETLGLIGRNGAGKSTLLSMLAGLVAPTFGKIETNGSVAVLLGSGIAFTPETSGRENAKSYCRLNGISQRAIPARIAEIESFAELGDYFDMPVGAYSSGMQARLSFACAIAKHADVLIVDEVLAVGDAEFKAKCYDYIKARQTEGQTYVLVSHSPTIIANFCTRVCLLEHGSLEFIGAPREALERYKILQVGGGKTEYKASLSSFSEGGASIVPHSLEVGSETIDFDFFISTQLAGEGYILRFQIKTDKGVGVENYEMPLIEAFALESGIPKRFSYHFNNILRPGRYWIQIVLAQTEDDGSRVICIAPSAFQLDVTGALVGGIVDLAIRPSNKLEHGLPNRVIS